MVGLTAHFSGLALWNIDVQAARQAPIRATVEALEAAVRREKADPHSAWTGSLREGVAGIADELKHFLDPAGLPGPARQMSLIVAAISQRTGFTARYALGRPAADIRHPLRPVHLARLPDPARQAILQTETALDRLAGDFLQLRQGVPDKPDQPDGSPPAANRLRLV